MHTSNTLPLLKQADRSRSDVAAQSLRTNRPGILKVAIILWLIACAVFYAKQGTEVAQLQLSDPDNYMRLVQALRWIDGAEWHDLSQPRINPPSGIEMHWTRLPDLPIAAIVLTLQGWLGRSSAVVVAAFVTPALLLLGILLASSWAARPILSQVAAPNAALVTLMALPLVVQFAPGRVDHHNWQLLLAMLTMGALLRVLLCPRARTPAIAAAGASALALWVSVEAVVWLVALCATLCVSWMLCAKRMLGAAAIFSFTLFTLSVATLALVSAPEHWLAVNCDSFSVIYVVFTGVIFLFWAALWLLAHRITTVRMRFAATALSASAAAAVMVTFFPTCLGHPFYQQVDPELAALWVDNIKELRSIFWLLPNRIVEVPYWIASPVLAVIIVLFRIANTVGRNRLLWIALAIHLILAFILSITQMRFFPLAHLYAVIPIAWLLGRLFQLVEAHWLGVRRALLMTGSLLAVGPFPSLALLMLFGAPTTEASIKRCDIDSVQSALSQTSTSKVIAAFINPGAELLFRTPHSVLAAGYHRNTDGNLHVYRLFSARDDKAALQIVQDRNVQIILVCPNAPEMAFYRGRGYTTFIERLIDGNLPVWLSPLNTLEESDELLFEVEVSRTQD